MKRISQRQAEKAKSIDPSAKFSVATGRRALIMRKPEASK
jgi:hypothetical protein